MNTSVFQSLWKVLSIFHYKVQNWWFRNNMLQPQIHITKMTLIYTQLRSNPYDFLFSLAFYGGGDRLEIL